MSLQEAAPRGVTIVIQTRGEPSQALAFAAWQHKISQVVAAQPGFVSQSVMPPAPPGQVDWVILQRFASNEAALAWLRSEERKHLLAEAEPLISGQDDVHLLADDRGGLLPAAASAVISTRIKPGQEEAYRNWARKIAAAQATFPGFQGYRFEPPVPGVQDDWLTILRFDSEENLQRWLDSPERKQLLDESAPFTEECHARIARTGFDQWFEQPGAPPPAAWKQNMVVLLVLYPLVFLLNAWLQQPVLVGVFGLPYWAFLFINNAVSVVVLSLILPRVSRRLHWWLSPDGRNVRRDVAGALLVAGFYGLCLLAFWLYQTRLGSPF
jgi:antibiotic biosynthesis monooxygenase (ABM) superfamily enzyme